MIKNREMWEAWEREYKRRTPVDPVENIRIAEGMFELARKLGKFPPSDPLQGIELKIRLAKALNALGTPRDHRA